MTVVGKLDAPAGDKPTVEVIEIAARDAGQRIDNFLIKRLKGVPKTRLYRALRSGEVRVNGARKKPPYQLQAGDRLRIPPLRRPAPGAAPRPPQSLLAKLPVLFEDAHILVVAKPAGLASHGGSGLDYGVIEALRHLREAAFLELVHRLDRDTSGCLMLAKSRAALVAMQARWSGVGKEYAALVKGAWAGGEVTVDVALARPGGGAEAELAGGDAVGAGGQTARSIFAPRRSWSDFAPAARGDAAPATGKAVTVDGGMVTVDGGAVTVDGVAESTDGGAATVDGGMATVDGDAKTVDGEAATVDGVATTVDGGAGTVDGVAAPASDAAAATGCALVTVRLLTGRMHQARRHAAAIGRPIAGDRRYGDAAFNRQARAAGLSRLFLHAERLRFAHPVTAATVEIHAPLPAELQEVLDNLPRHP